MTTVYGWLTYGKPQRKPGPRMTFAYDPPCMPSIFNNLLLLWISDTCAMPTPPNPGQEKPSQPSLKESN